MDSHEVRSHWAGRTGAYSPAYYAHHGPDARSEAVREALDRHVGPDASVLELGCSSGRHLAHLQAHGYEDLAGVDLNDDAFEVMEETYPDLAAAGTFHHGAIEDVVADLATDSFDAVYSVETLQHLHPEAEWAFAEIVRVTGDLLVTVENEGDERGRDVDGSDAADGASPGDGDRNGDVAGGGPGDGRGPGDGGGTRDASGDEQAARGSGSARTAVNYVDDDFPLFYRDWNRVFTDLGLSEVESRAGDRGTIRVFRAPETGIGR